MWHPPAQVRLPVNDAKLGLGLALILLACCTAWVWDALFKPSFEFALFAAMISLVGGLALVLGWVVSKLERGMHSAVVVGAPAAAGGIREAWDVILHPWISGKELFMPDSARWGQGPPISSLTKTRSILAIVFVHF